ncbi:MAG: cysteine desulfurase family protein [Candidatus Doudnabacteria bacterium]|jgi:cysteine desulfurase
MTQKKFQNLVYLDYAATTPMDLRVKKAMLPFESEKFGNPSSLHSYGKQAKAALENSRSVIAKIIGAKPSEIVFTAGGTESVNLAIFGVTRMCAVGKSDKHGSPHLITSTIEHHCVLNSFSYLKGEGSKTSLVEVDKLGRIDLNKLKASVRPETILISVMFANNEIGTIQPIEEIGKWLKVLNSERQKSNLPRIFFHTDACQAAGYVDLSVDKLGVDLISVNGSKIYGPKQTGFLYVKTGTPIASFMHGGEQEKGLRAGTENVPGVVGLAKAFELAQAEVNKENVRLLKLQKFLTEQVIKLVSNVLLNGADNSKLKVNDIKNNKLNKLPNNINLTFLGAEGEALLLYLDSYGFSVSTSSACTANEPSYVLLAIGRSLNEAKSSIRFSLGKSTTLNDIKNLLKILPKLVTDLRKVYTNK